MTPKVGLSLAGASRATLEGKATDASFHAAGSSSLKLPGLVLQNADIKLSVASHATVNVTGNSRTRSVPLRA